jgi:Fe(3+) dicitrate transport protein
MRLNVGIRGLNPDRSRQLLVLEDGLPLAPYGEPEMYYSPPIDRMSRVEILKGSGSIVHGPQTIGGVMNFVTPDPPPQRQGQVEVLGGERGVFIGQASYGGTTKGVGWFINGLRKQGDGWRDFYYRINDITPKFNFQVADRHRFGLKLGYYDEESNSTYLGLTEGQFRSNPNFNAVPDDLLEVDRTSGSLLHQFVITLRALLSTTAFGYSTRRDWRRQDFDRTPRPGVGYLRVEGDPSVPGGAIYLRNSTTNNNRSFDVAGAESRLAWEHDTFGWRQKLDAGFRYLWEEHCDQQIAGPTYNSSEGTVRSDEIRNGNALSGFVQDRIFVSGRLSLTPGLRLEHYDYTRNILRRPVGGILTDVNILGGDTVSKAIPGMGATWQATSDVTVYGGVHRGFAPPRVKDAITPDGVPLELDAELSWNYEVGARGQVRRGMSAEATFFRTDFSNQIIPASISGGATSTLMNAGETLHQGAEFLLAADFDRLLERTTGATAEMRYTWLGVAEFQNGIYAGNRLPYAPVHLLSMNAGYRHRRGFTVFLDGTRVGDQFADNRETLPPSNDGTAGVIPAYWVWNLCAGYEWSRERYSLKPFVTVKNFTDSLYISSRAPQGIQPGMFRQVNAGVRFRF